MYIEFSLPYMEQLASNERPQEIAISMIERDLKRWSEQYKVTYTTRHMNNTYKVFLGESKYYSFFGITYKPYYRSSSWKRIRIVKQAWDD